MGELAGGGSLAVAVGTSDMRPVTCDTGHMTTNIVCIFFVDLYVLVLLSAHIKRFSVSHMRNLCKDAADTWPHYCIINKQIDSAHSFPNWPFS